MCSQLLLTDCDKRMHARMFQDEYQTTHKYQTRRKPLYAKIAFAFHLNGEKLLRSPNEPNTHRNRYINKFIENEISVSAFDKFFYD